MAARPNLGRDDSYNRVTVSRDLKSQIMSMIADSSESLPLGSVSESDEDNETAATSAPIERKPQSPPSATTNGTSAIAAHEPMNASDMATPTPEKPNPLEQVPTVRVDSKKPTASVGEAGQAGQGQEDGEHLGVADLATPSPMRSHETDGPHLGILGKTISNMVGHSETDVAHDKEQEPLGTTTSRTTTVSQTPSGVGSGKTRPGMDKRQSTMKRISSVFKRTVSKNQ